MDLKVIKLLNRTTYDSPKFLKLLLLPVIFVMFEVIVLHDQPLINSFSLISSSLYLNSSFITTSWESAGSSSISSGGGGGNSYSNSSFNSSLKSFTDAPPPPPPPSPSGLTAASSTIISRDSSNVSSFNLPGGSLRVGGGGGGGGTASCNIFKGDWVPDPEAPYYTNNTCNKIQHHQNCLKYGRPDLDFLKWRWKPHECELPRFDPLLFLEIVRGKTMAFVGDSLARNHMQSLLCLLARVGHPKDMSETKDDRFKRWYYSNYNFTILIFWSPFLVKALEKDGLWHIYLDEIDTNWASRIEEFDYLIISDSNWYTRRSLTYLRSQIDGCIYCGMSNITARSFFYVNRLAFQTVFRAIGKDSGFKGLAILRTVSPSHFENGPWDKGGNCNRTKPFRSNETTFHKDEHEMYTAQLEVYEQAKEEARVKRREIELMDMTDAMLLRPDGHPNSYGNWPHEHRNYHKDCVHWCLPGPVDLWNEFLLHMLSSRNSTAKSSSSPSSSSSSSKFESSNSSIDGAPSAATTRSKNESNASSYSSFNVSRDASRTAVARNCNIFRGEWVPDPDQPPYYTNNTCNFIQKHQNCLRYGRPDLDFLKWRWKPQECELLRFDPVRFLQLVRGKSMAFVGDSLARNHMQSLLCLLTRAEHPKDVSDDPDLRFKRWHYTSYNFSISAFWSPFLVKAQEMDNGRGQWRVYLDEIDTKWASRIAEFDYLIISDSNWFTRPSMYFKGSQLHGCNYCGRDTNITVRSFHYVNKEAFRTVFAAINDVASFRGLTILRTVSPSHFENGPWNKGGNCNRTRPFLSRKEATFHDNEHQMYAAQFEVFEKAKAEAKARGREIRLMDMTEAMLVRPDGHPNRYGHRQNEFVQLYNDCAHWCLPGPVDVWNEFLLHMLST